MTLPHSALIREALEARLHEVWSGRIRRLTPEEFGIVGEFGHSFVSELQAQTDNETDASLCAYLYEQTARAERGWMCCEADCLHALMALALGKHFNPIGCSQPPVEPFLTSLRAVRREPQSHFQLLIERYIWPLNITHDAEHEVREQLLEGLMVRDRVRVEKGAEAAASHDVLLKLNLLAIYAASAASTDLRYLDALNYYYEILPEKWRRSEPAPWLYASYLGLYARALSSWLNLKL